MAVYSRGYSQIILNRRIYILILPFTHDFLVGSAHVRSQATVHAFMQSMQYCMHEGRGYRYTFQRARVASSPEVPKVT